SDSEDIEPRGYIPDPVDLSHLADNPPVFDTGSSGVMRVKAAALNSSYRSSYVTSVKNQGGYGTCWAHAALGAVEASALKNSLGNLDLSEFHMAYFVYGDTRAGKSFTRTSASYGSDTYLDQGGNSTQSVALLSRLGGPTAETILPYPDLSISYSSNKSNYTKPTGYPEDAKYAKTLFLKETYELGKVTLSNRDTIKQMIQTYGAVQASYYSGGQTTALNGSEIASDDEESLYNIDTGYNKGSGGTAYYYPSSGTSTNHAILLVGWDDDYASTNFNPQPPSNGAWLVKNSWGTSWGDSGYFWMSYNQYITNAVVYQAEAITANLKHYGYDDLGMTGSFGYGAGKPGWGANVFKAESSETLKKIAFYTTDNNTSYTIYIYKNLTSNASPVTGGTQAYTKSGTIPCAGYHTLDVGSISLASGEYFSVIVKFTTPSSVYSIPIETSSSNFASPVVHQRESYYASGTSMPTSWTDAYKDGYNICIKAFTVPGSSSSSTDDNTAPTITTSSLAAGTVGTAYSTTLTASGTTPITWSVSSGSLPTGLSLNASTGIISGTPSAAGTFSFTVTASNSAGSNTKSLSITVSTAASTGTAPVITTASLATGTVGTAYNVTLTATGTTPITFSISSGTLPTG
ncbi:MAG: putative Ig domain-containing protein, partial [Synergistaceae bacterium]|nr:putative Ig domain-containing protein [Synergistaceae bacterium]